MEKVNTTEVEETTKLDILERVGNWKVRGVGDNEEVTLISKMECIRDTHENQMHRCVYHFMQYIK
jgi:hypothetical protein